MAGWGCGSQHGPLTDLKPFTTYTCISNFIVIQGTCIRFTWHSYDYYKSLNNKHCDFTSIGVKCDGARWKGGLCGRIVFKK